MNLTESEKNRIRGLHNITNISESRDDTPGGNPGYFFGDLEKLKGILSSKSKQGEEESMSDEDIASLERMVQKYSPEKILVTLEIIKNKMY